jgi:hypothetical protein
VFSDKYWNPRKWGEARLTAVTSQCTARPGSQPLETNPLASLESFLEVQIRGDLNPKDLGWGSADSVSMGYS